MPLEDREPYTVLLAGLTPRFISSGNIGTEVKLRVGVIATPGMLIERYKVVDELKWRPNASATEIAALSIALDKPYQTDNTGIDDDYAVDEDMDAAYLLVGDLWYPKVVSGETVTVGTLLQSNGNGWLKAATLTTQDAMLGRFQSEEELNGGSPLAADTRCRVRRIA